MRPLASARARETGSTGEVAEHKRPAVTESSPYTRPWVGALLEGGPDAVLAVDPQWRVVYANRRVAGLRERNAAPSDLVGRTLAETVPEIWERMEAVLRLAAAEGAPYSVEEYFPGLDAWLEVRACPLPGGLCLWVREVNERIERQATLFESDNRLRSLVDNLPAAATYQLVRDPDGTRRFLYVSRGIERLNRVSAEAVLEDASVLYNQFLPEYRQIVEEAEAESVRTMRPFHCEVPIRIPIGELRWFELVSSPRLLRDGRIVWDGLLVDVTARKHAEHTLRRQSELATMLQEVATAANEASSVHDALRFGLQRVCRLLQWPLGSAWVRNETGELVSAGIYHGEQSLRVAAFLPEVAGGSAATSLDLPFEALANDRSCVVTRIAERSLPRYALAARAGFGTALYCPVHAAGGIAALLEFFAEGAAEVDSTALAAVDNVATQLGRVFERVRAEEDRARHLEQEQAARAEAERRALEEAALRKATAAVANARTQDDVIGEIARKAVTALCAEGAYVERIQPGSPEVVVAAVAGARVPRVGAHISYVGSLSETVLARGTPELVPDFARAARPLPAGLTDGCRGCSGLAVPLAEGRAAIGALVLVRGPEMPSFSSDEIERARIFSELASLAFARVALIEESEAKRRELERVMESRARLIRGFSHDVKNPLSGADGYAQMLENGLKGALTVPQQETVGRLRAMIGSALSLIQDLLELARAETGVIELERVRIDVLRLAADVAEEFRPSALARGIDIRTRGAADVLTRSDPARVRQILENLISNALKYASQESIDIHVAVRVGRRAGDPFHWVAIDVIDSGPGIARDQLDHIFREFTRLAPGYVEGTGVGLAISRRLARLLGGDLTVESELGKGSTFTLWLPLTV